MKLSPVSKFFLSIATFWPVAWLLFMLAWVLRLVNSYGPRADWLATIFMGHVATVLVCCGLLVFYALHAFKNERLDKDARFLWIILMCVAGLVAQPIYYLVHVAPDDKIEFELRRRNAKLAQLRKRSRRPLSSKS